MGARGRRPKSAVIKLLAGNRGKRRLEPERDVSFDVGAPKPPAWLKGDGLWEWNRIVNLLLPVRVMTPADFGIVLLAAEAFADWMELGRICRRKKGHTYREKGAAGQWMRKPHLEFKMQAEAQKRYLRALIELGLTTASRTRVKAVPFAEKSGVGKFFA